MKLNGWQRIGIVASVVWFLGAYNYEVSRSMAILYEFAGKDEDRCVGRGGTYESCRDAMNVTTDRDWHEVRKEVAIMEAIPIPLGWGFAYLILFVVRWVRRGFA